MFVLTWLLGVSRSDTWLFLPDLVEVQDVGACVVRLWSHVVASVFRELLCLGGCVPRSIFASALLEFLLLWLLFEFIAYLTGLNSNPSGSSDPWVAARPSGVPGRGLGGRVVTVVSELRGPTRFVMVGVFARAKQMLVCCVAPLAECCGTWLRLLSALCWLVVNSKLCCARFWLLRRCPLVEVHRLAAVFWWCFLEVDSLSQEFVAGRSWWRFVAPCVGSSVSCERECSCSIRRWRHDLRGSLAGVREVRSLQHKYLLLLEQVGSA
ncbi:hypothetical protein Taro_024989 [Colocasia esculenta]|uniref:Uncharacterized protein n=1 Tax=Colocasia esculenta TaxID=4460 RepID=A0A843V883_COLES|nr:hypothetical protein [Colocasia esculenta]